MKILIISRSFFPEISPRSFRTTELVKELSRQGHNVTLLTKKNDDIHLKFEQDFNIRINDIGTLNYKQIPHESNNGVLSLIIRAINRALLMLFEFPDIELVNKVSRALKNESSYDLLISIAVPFPIHWGVAKAISKNRDLAKTWIADCGDPFMGNTNDSFRKLFYFKYVEKWFCRIADFISIPKIEMKETYYPEFHYKIREIPQGFNFNDVRISQKLDGNACPTFAFAGSFIKVVRDPARLLNFLSTLQEDFLFIVYTKDIDYLAPFKDRLGHRLEIRDYIPRLDLIFELSKMDFLINIAYNPVTQSPSKLIDYALSGRPILSLPSNEVDENVFHEFLQGKYTRQFDIGDIQKYNITNVARQFIELVK